MPWALDDVTHDESLAEYDGINPFAIGKFTADNVPGAVFAPLADGGHLLLGHQSEVRRRVGTFLLEHSEP